MEIRDELKIALFCLVLVIGMGFFMFNIHLTGFVVSEDFEDNTTITRDNALEAINESEVILKEMGEMNFSVTFIEDVLGEAKIILEQVDYAEILRNKNSSTTDKKEAQNALRLIKWNELNYADVIIYTDDIKNRRDQAFKLNDLIALRLNQVTESDISGKGIFQRSPVSDATPVLEIIDRAKEAFNKERYDETEILLEEARVEYESQKLKSTTFVALKNGASNFFQRYWWQIIIFVVIAGILIKNFYKKINKNFLRKKIRKIKAEQNVLENLIKKTQTERFKENKISGLVYNIRMKKYKERIDEIKQQIPVLESRLKDVKIKKEKDEKK